MMDRRHDYLTIESAARGGGTRRPRADPCRISLGQGSRHVGNAAQVAEPPILAPFSRVVRPTNTRGARRNQGVTPGRTTTRSNNSGKGRAPRMAARPGRRGAVLRSAAVSLGGMIGQWLAANAPDRVTAVVLGEHVAEKARGRRRMKNAVARTVLGGRPWVPSPTPSMFQSRFLFAAPASASHPPPAVRGTPPPHSLPSATNPVGLCRLLRGDFATMGSDAGPGGDSRVPMLIVNGEARRLSLPVERDTRRRCSRASAHPWRARGAPSRPAHLSNNSKRRAPFNPRRSSPFLLPTGGRQRCRGPRMRRGRAPRPMRTYDRAHRQRGGGRGPGPFRHKDDSRANAWGGNLGAAARGLDSTWGARAGLLRPSRNNHWPQPDAG